MRQLIGGGAKLGSSLTLDMNEVCHYRSICLHVQQCTALMEEDADGRLTDLPGLHYSRPGAKGIIIGFSKEGTLTNWYP